MKRLLPLLTLMALLIGAPALAQPAELPADARFDQLVAFSTGVNGEDLGTMLTALARAVGLTPIVDDVPVRTIVYDIGEPKPFRQVWTLVLTLTDLDYLLEENDIVVLGTPASLDRLREPEVEDTEPRFQRFYRVFNEVDQVARLVELAVRDARVEGVAGAGVISVVAAEAQHEQVVATLAEYDLPIEEPELAVDPEPRFQRFYAIRGDPAQLAALVRLAIGDDDAVTSVAGARVISVLGSEAQHELVVATLAEYDPPVAEPEPVTEVDPDPRVQTFYRVNTEAQPIAGLLERAALGVQVDVIPDTNILSIVGTAAQQEAATGVLAEFDTIPERIAIEQRTVFLSHAIATNLAETLQETGIVVSVTTDRNGTGQPTDDTTTTRETDFRVVPDSRTNSLVLTGTRPVLDRLSALIAELDVAQRQVNVQVRIQEITRRSAFDLGIDWSTGIGNFTANILAGGLNFIFDTTQVISSLNVLAVLDTLETQGLTRRVDDSNVTVLNNDKATIQSGGQIFITLPPDIQRTIPYGVQVDVTPRITADGRITLVVSARVEDVVSATGDPTFLNLASRNMNTTVTVEEGQTLLLGGLLQSSLSITRQRIPILGALPLIGDLFGRTLTEEDDVDLLLIVTANVID